MAKINGKFVRMLPKQWEGDELPLGWFVLSYRWVQQTKARRVAHGGCYRITSKYGSVYRILRFDIDLRYNNAQKVGDMVIDWPAWLELCDRAERVPDDLELTIKPVRGLAFLRFALKHPDPAYRLASNIAVFSLGLGLISFTAGILPYFL